MNVYDPLEVLNHVNRLPVLDSILHKRMYSFTATWSIKTSRNQSVLSRFLVYRTPKCPLYDENHSILPHGVAKSGLWALLLCYTDYLNSCKMSKSRIYLAPEVLEAICSTGMWILEGVTVCNKQNDFLWSRDGEKCDFVKKKLGHHHVGYMCIPSGAGQRSG